ncbi:family 16 glycosylhydrolase [Salinarimonas soli]|uniref:Family 16 glycosylhydrolase n=1 Tax=Salinarimonas soli TaxID=1638099 RepID=A0A5B2VG53_9HYPH|nr:family 16 glycosylhydrolase [Salinarimonas soli]KAA2237127.1 family 16 glycosylhydrolase [Salinarimonas soli]
MTARLTFSEEFNGDHLDLWNGSSGTWRAAAPWISWDGMGSPSPNNQLEKYINPNHKPIASANPFDVQDGALTITASRASPEIRAITGKEYASGEINTFGSFDQQYGYFEIKAQLPGGKGLWPAFWLLPADKSWPPELDVMEVLGHEPDMLHTTVHSSLGNQWGHTQEGHSTRVGDMTNGYHTYGVNWQADKITWYFDGQQIFQAKTPDDMHKSMYMIANLAVGGDWPGSPDGNTKFPAEYKIDYIRAYTDKPTGDGAAEPPPTPSKPPVAPAPVDQAPQPHDPAPTPDPVDQAPQPHDPAPAPTPDPVDHAPQPAPAPAPDPIDAAPQPSQPPAPQPHEPAPAEPAPTAQHLRGLGWGEWSSHNTITGTDGSDHLVSTSRTSDLMDGGAGADRMEGGCHDDVYVVNHKNDAVIEHAGSGTDTVRSSLDTYTLADNVETLVLQGTGHQTGIGNALGNVIFANGTGSTIDAGAGDDDLFAGKGADILTGGEGQDRFIMRDVDTAPDHITDFQVGVDMLDLRQLFAEIGYRGSDPVGDKHLIVQGNDKGGTDVLFDWDGAGDAAAKTIVTLDHVRPDALHLQADIWVANEGATLTGASALHQLLADMGEPTGATVADRVASLSHDAPAAPEGMMSVHDVIAADHALTDHHLTGDAWLR